MVVSEIVGSRLPRTAGRDRTNSAVCDSCVDDHKLPPNETDQVQPIDRGLGRQVKVYLGQQVAP